MTLRTPWIRVRRPRRDPASREEEGPGRTVAGPQGGVDLPGDAGEGRPPPQQPAPQAVPGGGGNLGRQNPLLRRSGHLRPASAVPGRPGEPPGGKGRKALQTDQHLRSRVPEAPGNPESGTLPRARGEVPALQQEEIEVHGFGGKGKGKPEGKDGDSPPANPVASGDRGR